MLIATIHILVDRSERDAILFLLAAVSIFQLPPALPAIHLGEASHWWSLLQQQLHCFVAVEVEVYFYSSAASRFNILVLERAETSGLNKASLGLGRDGSSQVFANKFRSISQGI